MGDDATCADDYLRAVARRLGGARAQLACADSRDDLLGAIVGSGVATVVEAFGGTPPTVADIRAIAASKAVGSLLVVDVTATTTHGCAAVRLGADIAFAEVGSGVYVVALARGATGALASVTARLAPLGTPPIEQVANIVAGDDAAGTTWRAASDAAAVIANYLVCHPAIATVRYPGLRADPCFELAAHTLTSGFGATVGYTLATSPSAWKTVAATATNPCAQVMALEHSLAVRSL